MRIEKQMVVPTTNSRVSWQFPSYEYLLWVANYFYDSFLKLFANEFGNSFWFIIFENDTNNYNLGDFASFSRWPLQPRLQSLILPKYEKIVKLHLINNEKSKSNRYIYIYMYIY